MELQDFEINVRAGPDGDYVVSVDRSPGGETSRHMQMPYEGLALENRLQQVQIALLSSLPGRRRISSDAEVVVRDFGQALFDALIADEVRNVFDVSRARCAEAGKGLRIRLSFDTGALAALPWEFMFDERSGDFVSLSESTPIVRYLRAGQPPRPLMVEPPLRLLALVASPNDRAALDIAAERDRLEHALGDLQSSNRVELHWAGGQSWRALQHELRHGPWHVFHFIGHGGFDTRLGEGVLALVGDNGGSELVSATNLGRLLGDHQQMRLAVLNACEGARADDTDIFSSVATTLVRKGTPAIVGMQYEITDTAAIEVSRVFYEAIADGLPVDLALTDARKAVCLAMPGSLEWGVPVLYTHTDNGVLFELGSTTPRATVEQEKSQSQTVAPPPPPPPPPEKKSTTRGESQKPEPSERHGSGVRTLAVVAAAVVLVVAGALAVTRPWSSDKAAAPPAGVTASIPVSGAHELGIGSKFLWITANAPTSRVTSIDTDAAQPGGVEHSFTDRVGHVVESHGRVWVTQPATQSVIQLDPVTLAEQRSIVVGHTPNDLETGADHLYLSDSSNNGTIWRIDPSSFDVRALANVEHPLADLAYSNKEVWAAESRGKHLYRVSVNGGTPQSYDIGDELVAVMAYSDAIWVTDAGTGSVLRVDPNDPTHPTRIAVDPLPWGLAAGGGAVWVVEKGKTNSDPSTVARIDPSTNKVTKRITVGAGADGVVWMNGALWVASEFPGDVTRITG